MIQGLASTDAAMAFTAVLLLSTMSPTEDVARLDFDIEPHAADLLTLVANSDRTRAWAYEAPQWTEISLSKLANYDIYSCVPGETPEVCFPSGRPRDAAGPLLFALPAATGARILSLRQAWERACEHGDRCGPARVTVSASGVELRYEDGDD